MYIQTPSNPTLQITHIHNHLHLTKQHHSLTFLHNTFLTPPLHRPLHLPLHLLFHTPTKFFTPHTHLLSPLALVKDHNLADELYSLQNS
ncbi:PLP-dependent transferase, partial [Bacillus pumilus]|uniref:PLP-dependent transferase n=1 Tax=Bacillus pumilus TaxID=1408 RepID=UPI0034D97307